MEELIIDGTTGMIVSPEDEKSLAEAMLRLFNNPALRRELGQSAYQRTQKEFTWECVAERIAQVVSESNGFRRRG
jgi:glycosyltransferase involved in cell wall biosynthesis